MRALELDTDRSLRSDYDPSESEQETKKAINSAAVWKDPSMSVESDRGQPPTRTKY